MPVSSRDTTRQALLDYLRDELEVDVSAIQDDTALFTSGLVDSFSLVDLIVFLQSKFGFKMSAKDVHLDNLDTLEKILGYLEETESKDGQTARRG